MSREQFERVSRKRLPKLVTPEDWRERYRQRLLAKVRIAPSGCWEWLGARDPRGYGRFQAEGHKRAHRAAWALFRGPIPAGLLVCHHCDNPPCCNPDHLFVGTMSDNIRDGYVKGRIPIDKARHLSYEVKRSRTHCYNGHEYTAENVRYRQKAEGPVRVCRACAAAQRAARSQRDAADAIRKMIEAG